MKLIFDIRASLMTSIFRLRDQKLIIANYGDLYNVAY